jgi:drug/metabolite transporter (DMT)-like permease
LSGGSAAGATASLIGAACASLAAIQTRRLTRYEKTGAIVFYFSALTTAVSLAFLIAAHFWPGEGWLAAQKWSWPAPGVLALLCGIGVFGGIGQITLTESYRYAEASVISPLEYVSMLWAATFGYVFFGDAPSIRILIGAAIVAGAGLYLIFRERKAEAR